MSEHPLCCECDLCVGPGVSPGYAPIVHKTPGRATIALKGHHRGDVVALAHAYRDVMARWEKRRAAA